MWLRVAYRMTLHPHPANITLNTIEAPTILSSPALPPTHQQRSASPLERLASSSRHMFHLALFMSTLGLMEGWPVKSARTLMATLVVLGLAPQSAVVP